MDEEMEDFVEDAFSPLEFDSDYEFDSPCFFDFSRPESEAEVREAEGWFDSAKTYPPSPFIVKLNWSKGIPFVEAAATPNFEDGESIDGFSKNSEAGTYPPEVPLSEDSKGQKYPNHVGQDIPKAKAKSMAKSFKPRSAALMKPTASHLAKQNKARELKSSRLCRSQFLTLLFSTRFSLFLDPRCPSSRSQKPQTKGDERSLQNPPGPENQATKRQKLESGYLRKVGTIDPNSTHFRAKVTIPKEPDLETAQRAQRQRSKNYGVGKHAKADVHTFKARPLNRKILEAPSLPFPKKSTPQLPEFHVFHLKTMERAMQHSSANVVSTHNIDPIMQSEETGLESYVSRPNSEDVLKKEKAGTPKNIFARKEDTNLIRNIKQEAMVPTFMPPLPFCRNLSLKSESETETKSQSKPHHCVKMATITMDKSVMKPSVVQTTAALENIAA
ncbi:hypothetical protein RJ639_047012 [Escallonia herrerae]|uniref:TPX2 central domain-containing protein n=1 Tax=Escallonia herrerae TaxID=1293975 RepID=A0AA88WGZ1_9ASTE|nr:hypothetical protein RJ639_047012 [Escallonia herrerae]